jgi:hypothetical protein
MPAKSLKRTSTQAALTAPTAKKSSSPKIAFFFEHTCPTIIPKKIEVILDVDEQSYTFNEQVSVVWKQVQHSGIQPPKSFDRKDGTGKFDKPVGLELFIDVETDALNNQVISTLNELTHEIARQLEKACKEVVGKDYKFQGREMFRLNKDGDKTVIDLNVTKSELQISGKKTSSKPDFLDGMAASLLRKEYLDAFPEADQNCIVVADERGGEEEGEYLVLLKNANQYYNDIFQQIGDRMPESEFWKYCQFEHQIISVVCNLTGSRTWSDKATKVGQVKPNIYLDRIRVFLDGERDNGDNARWCMKYYYPKISVERLDFINEHM